MINIIIRHSTYQNNWTMNFPVNHFHHILMNTIHDFHASVESISQLWNLFHQVRNEGTFFPQLWNLFHQVIYRNKFHISRTYIIYFSCEIYSIRT
jgi:hypothetical protein